MGLAMVSSGMVALPSNFESAYGAIESAVGVNSASNSHVAGSNFSATYSTSTISAFQPTETATSNSSAGRTSSSADLTGNTLFSLQNSTEY